MKYLKKLSLNILYTIILFITLSLLLTAFNYFNIINYQTLAICKIIIPILSLGGKGVISVLSNVMPKYTVEMLNSFWKGDCEKAGKMQVEAMDMIDALFCEVNPIPVKYALNEIGYDFGKPRLPLVELSDRNKEKVDKVLRKYIKK